MSKASEYAKAAQEWHKHKGIYWSSGDKSRDDPLGNANHHCQVNSNGGLHFSRWGYNMDAEAVKRLIAWLQDTFLDKEPS